MNERIKELALQAGFQWTKFGLVARFPESNPEKFAELIVRECATFVNNVMPVYSKQELDLCKRTAKQMKMYFGVKK